MLDIAQIKQQIARLTGLSFPPTAREGWHELAKVLQRRCATMDHVERVIDRWLDAETDVPKPVQLAALCSDVPADAAMDHPILAPPCEECGPEGWFRMVQRIDRHGDTVWSSARCTCPRGRQLAVMDANRTVDAGKGRRQPARLSRIDGGQEVG